MEEIMGMLSQIDPALLTGIAAGVAVMIIEIILTNTGKIFSKGKKRLAQAKAKGHVVTATLVDSWFTEESSDTGVTERLWTGKYAYTVGGIPYTKKIMQKGFLPGNILTLYYDTNPAKAYTQEEMTRKKGGCLVYLIPLIVAVVVAMAIGYRG